MLVYHSYAMTESHFRVGKNYRFSFYIYGASVRRVKSCEAVHKGCLPRSVFAQNAVYLSGEEVKINFVIRILTVENFINSAH